MAKKIIAVVGATGAQGGGLAKAILADPDGGFTLRALTRKVDGEKAQALAKQGAEVVKADIGNPEDLKSAFNGAHGAFCITNYWAHFSVEKEQAQAKEMAWAGPRCVKLAMSGEDDNLTHLDLAWRILAHGK